MIRAINAVTDALVPLERLGLEAIIFGGERCDDRDSGRWWKLTGLSDLWADRGRGLRHDCARLAGLDRGLTLVSVCNQEVLLACRTIKFVFQSCFNSYFMFISDRDLVKRSLNFFSK